MPKSKEYTNQQTKKTKMSSLLDQLNLDYEIYADDPIKRGIELGQSVIGRITSDIYNLTHQTNSNDNEHDLKIEQQPKMLSVYRRREYQSRPLDHLYNRRVAGYVSRSI